MSAVKKVLIVGGGPAGMSAAIAMRRHGIDVELVEIDPAWRPLGTGISISGATLRAIETLGLYDAFLANGATHDGVELCTPDGRLLAVLPTPRPVGSSVAGEGAVMRPALARIMAEATRKAEVDVRLGCTYTSITQRSTAVTVEFTDGTTRTYDLVVGADGLHSRFRESFYPEVAPPHYVGQVVWRAVLPRPLSQERLRIWIGDQLKIGVNPTSSTQAYMFITEDRPERTHIDPARWPQLMAALIQRFPDPALHDFVPHMFAPAAAVDYRPLFNLLVPLPWNRGRMVLIGDAVAATTPHLASGAGIGIESGIVLAEELARNDDLQSAFDAFHARRWERCRMVVENSARLCQIEIENGDKEEHERIMRDSIMALIKPI